MGESSEFDTSGLNDIEAIKEYLQSQQFAQKAWREDIMNMFLTINGCTVLFMQCGFALLEAGAVRSKNVTNILLKNFLDLLVGIVVYWAVGFAFAYGKVKIQDSEGEYHYSGANTFFGHKHFFLTDSTGFKTDLLEGYPERVIHLGSFHGEFFFNFVFAATATTITSGALAERAKMSAYFIYGTILTGFIQPVTVHWTWSNGFLLYPPSYLHLPPQVYFRDYAGGVNVHAVGGIAALVGCIFIGPRIGRFDKVKKYHIPGHSTPLTGLGGFILMTGFLGMVLGHAQNIELSATNIVLGGASSGISAMMIKWVIPKLSGHGKSKQKWSFLTLVDSTLCGMVALCGGCNIIPPYGAVVIGVLASLTFLGLEHLLLFLHLDDPLGSFATHCGGGFVGCIMTPFFMTKELAGVDGILTWAGCKEDIAKDLPGWFDGACLHTPFYQLAWHIVGLLCITIWTIILSTAVFGLLWYTDQLRVSSDLEIRGIDIKLHGEPAYPNAAYGHGWDNEGDFSLEVFEVAGSQSGQVAGGARHPRRTVKALINPNLSENWTNGVHPGGLIEMTIAEQQKTMKVLKGIIEDDSSVEHSLVFPRESFAPLSIIGTGSLQGRLKARETVASTFNGPDGISNPAFSDLKEE